MPDKNVIAAVITPDKKDWHPVEQPPPFNGGSGAGATVAPSSPSPDPRTAYPGRQETGVGVMT